MRLGTAFAFRYFSFILMTFLTIQLTACTTTPVYVAHPQQFKLMSQRMPQELIARKLMTTNFDYTIASAPLGSQDYGTALYTGLNPAFLFDDVAQKSATSFAASLAPHEKVQMRNTGFTISATTLQEKNGTKPKFGSAGRRIDIDIIAISDWEGDGTQDWILTCRYVKNYGAYPRTYYMVVPRNASTSFPQQKLQSTVIAVYEEAGPKGRIYLRESKVNQTSHVQDVVPGLKNVTMPPSEQKVQEGHGVKERDL